MQTEVARILKLPDVRERLRLRNDPAGGLGFGGVRGILKREIAKWGAIVRESGAKVD